MAMSREPRQALGYFLRQAVSILLLAYLILAGGTLNGLIRFPLHVVSHVLIVIVLGVWLVDAWRRRRRIAAMGLEWVILMVMGAQVLATLLSTDLRRSAGWLGMMVVYGLFFYLVHDISKRNWTSDLLVRSLLIVGGIVVGWGLGDILSWYLTWLSQSGGRLVPTQPLRLYTLLGDANMLSGFLNLLLPLGIIRLINTRRAVSRLLLLGWLVGTLLVQLFTSSRGGWLGTVAIIAALVVLITMAFGGWRTRLATWWRDHRSRRWLVAPAVLLVILLMSAGGYVAWQMVQHPSHSGILEARRDFWASAWLAFLSSPLYGTGPFTYSTQFMKFRTILDRPYPHAHSLPLTVLSEGGLLGILALAFLVWALARRLWRGWRRAGFEQRLFMAGGLAALIGFAVHSLVDNHILVPTIGMTAIGIAALTLSAGPGRGTPDSNSVAPAGNMIPASNSGFHPLWLVIPSVLLMLGCFWSDWAYYPFWRGVQLTRIGDWQRAAAFLDEAAERDERLALYHLQRGYVYGVLAAQEYGSPTVAMEYRGRERLSAAELGLLEKAIEAYQRGIELEPYYSLNHANLSVLYWEAGQSELAIEKMQMAIELTPDVPTFHLNLARYAEHLRDREQAFVHYQRVLQMRPDLAEAGYFWEQTPIRRDFLAKWKGDHPSPPIPRSPRTYDDFLRVGWDAFRRSDWNAAQTAFLRARALAPSELPAYEGLARVNIELGDYIRAESFLRRGLNIFTQAVGDKLNLLLIYGEWAYRQGRVAEAARRYEAALSMVENPTIYGRGTFGWSPYGWFVFQRESIAPDMLPQLERLEITDDLAGRFIELAGWYEQLSQPLLAAQTYRRLLALVPGYEPARAGLEALESEDQ